jgi:hypothetical protein
MIEQKASYDLLVCPRTQVLVKVHSGGIGGATHSLYLIKMAIKIESVLSVNVQGMEQVVQEE